MPAFCFFLALGLGFSALLFWEANQQISIGVGWAVDVCSTSHMFCHIETARFVGLGSRT
jgi:hypothetical protein